MCSSVFAQFEDHYRKVKEDRANPYEQLYERDANTAYKLKIGERNIPISSSNGQNPDERQIEIIKNVLINDFLVNDDVTV